MDSNIKRVVLIAGHFMPEVGYFEVYLAKNLARLGLKVRVVTTNQVSPAKKVVVGSSSYSTGTHQMSPNIEVCRLPVKVRLGSMVCASGIVESTKAFKPDVILVLGVGKLFPYPVFELGDDIPIFSFFGENSDYYSNSSWVSTIKNKLLKGTVKRFVYNKAFRHSKKVVAYTPETRGILTNQISFTWNRKKLKQVISESSLGYDSSEFFFDKESREAIRRKWGLTDSDTLLITSTRVTSSKNLEKVIDLVDCLNAEGASLYYAIVGFHSDDYARELKAYIRNKRSHKKFICLGFSDHNQLRKYYSAADVGVWLRAAISIQEAMGTGLQLLLPHRRSVEHLIQEGLNGYFFDEDFDLKLKLFLTEKAVSREKTLTYNSRFSYEQILSQLFENQIPLNQ